MASEHNHQRGVSRAIEAYFRGLESGNTSGIPFTDDVRFYGVDMDEPVTGRDAVADHLSTYGPRIESLDVRLTVVESNHAFAIFRWREKTGIEVEICDYFELHAGRISCIKPYFDPRPFIEGKRVDADRGSADSTHPREQGDAADVRVLPPTVPLLAILLGVGLNRLWPIDLPLDAPLRYGLGALIILGAFLGFGLWAVVVMRRGGQSENPWKPTHHIELRGPFRLTRNPMYLQMVVGCIGFSILLANGWILLLTPLGAWVLQRFAILPEERYLEEKFGEAYKAYKRRVRRWI